MNNVGETFFSSPIDPVDLSKDWGRSDDDQRHRLVSTAPSTLAVRLRAERRPAGVFVAAVQHHSGVTTIQGTPAGPSSTASSSRRNAGVGSDFFSLNASVADAFLRAGESSSEGRSKRST